MITMVPTGIRGENHAGLTPQEIDSDAAAETLFGLLDDAPVLLVELDAAGCVRRSNRGFRDACGCTESELESRFLPDFLSLTPCTPEGYPYLETESWRGSRGGSLTVRWLKLWSYGLPQEARFLKMGVPLPEPGDQWGPGHRSQLDTFLDAAPDAIITIDDGGTMVSVNPATCALFGYEQSELVGRNVSMLMPSPDRERHDGYISHYLETGEARIIGVGREITALRRDGSTFPARLSVSEFESGGRRYFTGMLHDISERVEAEERQRAMFSEHAHASRVVALGEMASSIAHEINQPLAAIVSFADASRRLIETDSHDLDTLRHALRQISEQGQRAGAIIRRLREFVKKREPNRSTIEVNELIEAAVGLTAHDADRYGITLDFDLERRPLEAVADRLQIEQVILNLIRNSIDAINETGRRDGRITVSTLLEGDAFRVSVSDNGTGIKPSEKASIFDPFYSTKEAGTGLGLSISQSIAEAHGGQLGFEPNSGPGTTFTLTLPVHPSD